MESKRLFLERAALGVKVHCLLFATFTLLLGISSAHATTVTDPSGDGGGGPDIISMAGTYNTTTLFLSVRFQPGTFSPLGTNSGVLMGLNTDFNASTGCCTDPSVFFPLGAEYSLFYTASTGSGKFQLSSFPGGSPSFIADLTPTFVTDGFDLSVALSLVGGNGLLQFGMVAGTDNGTGTFDPLDFLVNDGPIAQGPTSSVPDAVPLPASAWLFVTGVIGLATLRLRRKTAPPQLPVG